MDKTFSRALESFNKIDRKMNEALALCEDENHTVCLGELFDLFRELEYARVYKDKLAVRLDRGQVEEQEEDEDAWSEELTEPISDVPYSYFFYAPFNRYTVTVYILVGIFAGLIALVYLLSNH